MVNKKRLTRCIIDLINSHVIVLNRQRYSIQMSNIFDAWIFFDLLDHIYKQVISETIFSLSDCFPSSIQIVVEGFEKGIWISRFGQHFKQACSTHYLIFYKFSLNMVRNMRHWFEYNAGEILRWKTTRTGIL